MNMKKYVSMTNIIFTVNCKFNIILDYNFVPSQVYTTLIIKS